MYKRYNLKQCNSFNRKRFRNVNIDIIDLTKKRFL